MEKINGKVKITAAAIALLIGIALIVAATYAWVSISKQPEVSNMHMNVGSSDILEIAAVTAENIDAGPPEVGTNDLSIGQGTWGKNVDLQNVRVILQAPATADPELGLSTVTYDANGRTNGLRKLIQGTATTDGMVYFMCEAKPAEYYVDEEGHIVASRTMDEKYCAAGGVAVWLRSNRKSRIKLDISNFTTEGGVDIPIGALVRVWTYNSSKGEKPEREGESRLIMFDQSRTDFTIDDVFSNDNPIEPGKLYMVEIVYYVEGNRDVNPNAVIAPTLTHPVIIRTAEMVFSRME